MREIKFRGKDIEAGKWRYGSLIKTYDGRRFVQNSGQPLDTSSPNTVFEAYEVGPETVGEFTGLIDRNGREIYEGDVVFVDYGKDIYGECISYTRLVEYKNGGLCFTGSGAMLVAGNCKYFSVIGNGHDNPELAKGGE